MGFTIVLVPTVQRTTCTFCCLGDRKYHHIIGAQTTLRDTFNFYVSQAQASFSGFKFHSWFNSLDGFWSLRIKKRLYYPAETRATSIEHDEIFCFILLSHMNTKYKEQGPTLRRILNSASWEQNPLGVANPCSWWWSLLMTIMEWREEHKSSRWWDAGSRWSVCWLLWLTPKSPKSW